MQEPFWNYGPMETSQIGKFIIPFSATENHVQFKIGKALPD